VAGDSTLAMLTNLTDDRRRSYLVIASPHGRFFLPAQRCPDLGSKKTETEYQDLLFGITQKID